MLKTLRDEERPGAEGERVPVGTNEEVRKRLVLFVSTMFESWGAMERATGIAHSTATAWKKRGAALPGTENLLTLASLGLSLDWVATGRGTMQLRLGSSERGSLLEDLRPYLQRQLSIGDHTGTQAFAAMVLRLGRERALELAGSGLAAEFEREATRLHRIHQHGELTKWIWDHLKSITDSGAMAVGKSTTIDLAAIRQKLFDYLPDEMKPGSALAEEYWEAYANGLRVFIEQTQLAMAKRALEDASRTTAKEPTARKRPARKRRV